MTPEHDEAGALAIAFRHHQEGRLALAEAGYRRVLEAAPGNVAVMQLLAVLSHQVGKSDVAVTLLRQAIALDPELAAAHRNLGIVLEERGDIAAAAASYRQAAALRPLDGEAHAHLARVLIAHGEGREATACLRRAAELRPDVLPDAGVHIALGNLLLRQGDVEQAVASYRQAVAAAPDLALAHSNLGNALRRLHRLGESAACLEHALALDPWLAEAHNNLGNVYLDQFVLPQAVACFERALALRGDFAEAHANLGNALQEQGHHDDAVAHYDAALTLRPDYPEALLARANALWQRGRLADAVAGCERAASRADDPAAPDIEVARTCLARPRALARAWDDRETPTAVVSATGEADPRLSATDVRAAYRALLGRDPESDEVVSWHLRHASDLEALLSSLIDAEEFRFRMTAGGGVTQDAVLRLLSLFSPREVVGYGKIRVGNEAGDGGYVMVADFADVVAALSAGVGTDVSWDLEISGHGIEVHQFDHTVSGPPVANERFHFHRRRIAARTSEDSDTVKRMIERISTAHGKILLKMDIEGGEWEVLDAAAVEDFARVAQAVVEFHGLSNVTNEAWRSRAMRTLGKLRSVFEVVHVHANNWSPVRLIANVPVPDMIEVTLVNRSMYEFRDSTQVFPTSLDRPNDKRRPDIFLGPMRFGS
ncbi:MAG TPA: tetratricopeptide repeat protein [Acidisphaera sp.]|nr:tetratricopeptide repeat protein [Acidisphaera sp.]